MHPTAWIAGYLFYIVLHNLGVLPPGEIDILDMGSYDVNGNMKDCLVEAQKSEMWDKSITHKYNYYGLDHARGFNVDIVGNIADLVSRNSTKYHLIVTSSALEHDDFFWETFNDLTMLLHPGGIMFLHVPTNLFIHRYPVDNWRFLPDAAFALQKWAKRQGNDVAVWLSDLLEFNSPGIFYDEVVMVFRKDGGGAMDETKGLEALAQYSKSVIRNSKRLKKMIEARQTGSELSPRDDGEGVGAAVEMSDAMLLNVPAFCRAPCCRSAANGEVLTYLPPLSVDEPHYSVQWKVASNACECQAELLVPKAIAMDRNAVSERFVKYIKCNIILFLIVCLSVLTGYRSLWKSWI